MAIYEYRCQSCGNEFEVMKPISKADEPSACPKCGGQGHKLPSIFASGESYKLNVPKGPAYRGDAGGAAPAATTAAARPPARAMRAKKK